MKLTNRVYQLSGVQYGTNSNTYAIDAGDQILLIDAGYSALQWDIMKKSLRYWGLGGKPVTQVFITHCHFDHAGNAYLAKQEGMKLLAGAQDAQAIETGSEQYIEYMFGREFVPTKVDHVLEDGELFEFDGISLEAIAVPGHSAGSFMFRIKEEGQDGLFMGDFLAIEPAAPKDDVLVKLAWTGAPDFSRDNYLASLKKMKESDLAILFPGHYYSFYGDSRRIFEMAYELGLKEL